MSTWDKDKAHSYYEEHKHMLRIKKRQKRIEARKKLLKLKELVDGREPKST